MADARSPLADFPWRVVLIAGGIVLTLILLGVLLLGGGDDGDSRATPPPGDPGATATTDDAGGDEEAAGDPQDAAVTGPVEDVPEPGTVPGLGEETDAATLARRAPDRAEEGTMEVRLFMVAPDLERLVGIPATVEAPATLEAQIRRTLDELITWQGDEMVSPLPPETVLHDVFVSPRGIAYVDVGGDLPGLLSGGGLAEIHAVYGIVSTVVVSFPEIRAVQVLVEHRQVETLSGHLDLSHPLTPTTEWVILERGLF